ncbi:ricin-type beta-trefoil lectin domain protein [Streptomyces sp. MUM 2J]|uniref:ricin-type beta-trefoil lectin domain protein n=1 Tax=Streptomyces sp. MUM 2J TaxID=2791987 RepID=UPI001F048ACA|nr:ricin-type beta-trefoil lectin domain protein [Streptomyces sp. MUM 2J]MCH0567394.1 ricin-type beta-trefoil lectin domain protein [Streptomyces sp. MUM 2J]
MPTPHLHHPVYPPPGGGPEESDESLAVRMRGGTDDEVAQSTGLLIARHWRPVHTYAAICLASSADVAAMATAAAFQQVFDRLTLGDPGAALRPRLLVAVRDVVRRWAATDRITEVLPQLLKPAGGRGMRAAKYMTSENRKLTEEAFAALPARFQCLLWHTEVEGEPISVPAALLGTDADTAGSLLEQAREKLREGCVSAHRERAPSKDCRFYNRLLDVPIRRGKDLLPDVQQHLDQCRHCRFAAEQLGRFEGRLGELLAEAVLGWGARRYLDSRPERDRPQSTRRGTARHRGGPPDGTRRRLLDRIPVSGRRVPRTPSSPRVLLTGVGLASAGVLTSLLIAGMWTGQGSGADPAASTTVTGGNGTGAGTLAPPVSTPPPASRQTRLRNAAADLCLDVRGRADAGAATQLALCSSAVTQQWSYESDGLLRSAADPQLCLDSHADAGVVILGRCADRADARADDIRYDRTARGEFLPRWDDALALATTTGDAGADVVVKVRDGSSAQTWLTDAPADS